MGDEWDKVIKEEMQAFGENQMWGLVPLPHGKHQVQVAVQSEA